MVFMIRAGKGHSLRGSHAPPPMNAPVAARASYLALLGLRLKTF
jgi:hypothetical protein